MGLNIAEVDVAISEQFDLTDLQRYALACGIQTYAMFAPMNPPDVAPSSVITRGTAPAYWLCES
ncbi:MAG: hypothetical protein WAQ25_03125 [Candidatus Saccharimonas sp.]